MNKYTTNNIILNSTAVVDIWSKDSGDVGTDFG
jgi:hypothetical protein